MGVFVCGGGGGGGVFSTPSFLYEERMCTGIETIRKYSIKWDSEKFTFFSEMKHSKILKQSYIYYVYRILKNKMRLRCLTLLLVCMYNKSKQNCS